MKEVIERCNWLVNKCNDKAITPDVKDDFRYLLEEIERLNKDIKVLLKENGNKEKVIKAQDSIIKEVRQDLLNTKRLNKHIKDKYNNEYLNMDIEHIDYLIKILDKENNNE